MLGAVKSFILDILFPIHCLGCNREGDYFCEDCQSCLDVSVVRYCLCNHNPVQISKCLRCKNKPLDGLFCPLDYKDKRIRKLISLFKYKPYVRGLAKPLADLILTHFNLLDDFQDFPLKSFVLMPIPLHKQKLRERGYNQAQELAKELAVKLGIPIILDNLVKLRPTTPQIKLSEQERQQNIKNIFRLKDSSQIKNQNVFLVDDVYTTGATMQECARILKRAHASQVHGIAIARG